MLTIFVICMTLRKQQRLRLNFSIVLLLGEAKSGYGFSQNFIDPYILYKEGVALNTWDNNLVL